MRCDAVRCATRARVQRTSDERALELLHLGQDEEDPVPERLLALGQIRQLRGYDGRPAGLGHRRLARIAARAQGRRKPVGADPWLRSPSLSLSLSLPRSLPLSLSPAPSYLSQAPRPVGSSPPVRTWGRRPAGQNRGPGRSCPRRAASAHSCVRVAHGPPPASRPPCGAPMPRSHCVGPAGKRLSYFTDKFVGGRATPTSARPRTSQHVINFDWAIDCECGAQSLGPALR